MEIVSFFLILLVSVANLIVGYILLRILITILEIVKSTDIFPKNEEAKKSMTRMIPLKAKSQLQYNQEQKARYFPDVASDPDKFFKNNNNAN